MSNILCHARFSEEVRRPDHQPLGRWVDRDDRVRIVQRIEFQCACVAPDLVRLIPTCGAGAQRIGNAGSSAVWASVGGGCDFSGGE